MKLIIKRIVSAILFFAIFFVIIMYEGFITRPYYGYVYNYNTWQYFYEEDDNTLNVVAVGSSAMYRFWMPPVAYEEQDFTSFVIGHTYQTFVAVPYIVEEIVKTQNPDVIMVETRSLLNERQYPLDGSEMAEPDVKNWLLSVVSCGMNYSSTRFNLISEFYTDTDDDCLLNWYVPLLKYHSLEYSLPLQSRLDRISTEKHPYKSAALLSVYSGIEVLDEFSMEKELYGEYVLTDTEKELLDRVVALGEKYGTEILFVSTPYQMTVEKSSLQLSLQMYMEEKGYSFIDLNDYIDEIGLDPMVDYSDCIHSNISGAEKITRYLAQYVADNYELDNVTLSEKQIKEWEDACDAYSERSAKIKIKWEANRQAVLESLNVSESDIATDSIG